LQYVIGIDLGGTAIKLGRFDRAGNCEVNLTVPTPQPAVPKAVLTAMVDGISQLDPDGAALAIGVGTPGPADAAGRVARVAINLSGWQNVPLADWLEEKTGKPTVLANDANCAGLGEAWLGAGRSFHDLILLTLGTGVGGAVILNGELFTGRNGTGAELGLIAIHPDGPDCNSGNRGSLEQYTSVQAIRRRTGLEPEELGQRATAGDPQAIAFWQDYGRDLGTGIASLLYVLTPEAVIIGGGISASAEFFLPSLQAELEQRVLPSSREGLQVLTAELGNQAGIVGAARLAWQLVEHQEAEPHTPHPIPHTPHSKQDTELLHWQLAYWRALEMAQFQAGFLARTSHELRSPLNSVISLHQLILAGLCDDPAEERECIAQSLERAQKMLGLLDDVIGLSKLEFGSLQPEMQPIPLANLLEEVHCMTYLQARNRNIQLQIDLPKPDLYVLSDRRWLKHIVLMLIDLPMVGMNEGAIRVGVSPQPESGTVCLQFEDEHRLQHWSEPFDAIQKQMSRQDSLLAAETQSRAEILAQIAEVSPLQRSPGLSLGMAKTLASLMQCHLEVVEARTSSTTGTDTNWINLVVPMVMEDI
jgi:glucokinase